MNDRTIRRARALKLSIALSLAATVALIWMLSGSAALAPAAGYGGGGLSPNLPSQGGPAGAPATRFGSRVLRHGMTGPDVRVLKGIVSSKALLTGSAVTSSFDRPTVRAVRKFQRQSKIASSGVVNKATARRLVGSMRTSTASWYGPGLFGNTTACGQRLRPGTMGVAHKSLPCGSKVMLGYRGRFVITRVIDRGPYAHGRTWDMTQAVQRKLKFNIGVGTVRHAVIKPR